MAPPQMPEELLLKILSYNLVLSDDAFTGHAFTNYGAGRFDLSRAHLAAAYPLARAAPAPPVNMLLVCRQWLRIGTPLLYEAVVVRSHAQLQQLAAALRASHAPGLGRLVRRLRFEATCAAFLDRVVVCTPNVHTLLLSLDVPTETGFHSFPYPSAGLRNALVQMRPRRLLLKREKYARNQRVDEMVYLISYAVRSWDSLVRVDLSNYFTMERGLADAFSHSLALQYISMYDCNINADLEECHRPSWLKTAARKPGLKSILCRGENPDYIKERHPGHVTDLLVHDLGNSPTNQSV